MPFALTSNETTCASLRRAGSRRCGLLHVFAWLVVLCSIAGCGSGEAANVPVRGEVFFGSEPAAGALVVLHPSVESDSAKFPGGFPYGLVDPDGKFEIATPKGAKGAPEGEYRVAITWLVPVPGAAPDDPEAATVDRLEGKWADPATSAITAAVKAPEVTLQRIELRK